MEAIIWVLVEYEYLNSFHQHTPTNYSMQLTIIWVRSFIEPDLFDNIITFVRQYYSDQSALEIRVGIRVRLTVALF